MDNIMECTGLSKVYKNAVALSGINLQIKKGRIVGLLGPNGSGKTTLIKLANGLLTPTMGNILIDGMPVGTETKKIVSYLPDHNFLTQWMSVDQMINYFSDFYADFNFDRADAMLKNLGIDIFHELLSQSEKEISLSTLPQRDLASLCTADTYQLERNETTFLVGEERIVVTDSRLGQALYFLSPKHRNVLLLHYFADKNELQIGKILKITAAAVNYRKKKGLDVLRSILEAMKYDEA